MDVLHAIVVGAAMVAFLFVLLWATEATGFAPTRFTAILAGAAAPTALSALGQGLPWALGFGAAGGASLAVFSNTFRFLMRRRG
jgi:hypothetical protein